MIPQDLSKMIQSMTGYAAAAAESPRGRLSIELRCVNSRFLDLQFRVAEELRALEPALREAIVARVARGKLDCRVYLNEGAAARTAARLDGEALGRLRALAQDAQRAFPDAAPLRVADILRWPGVVSEAQADDEAVRGLALELCNRALEDLRAARGREGAKLAAAVLERIAAMRKRVEEVGPLVPQAIAAHQRKIEERLREVLAAGQEERIRAEIALFASKVDIDEELDRLRAHFSEVERALKAGGAVGKRLDFLAQELNREANTLASKAATGAVSDCALELKLLVEQVRDDYHFVSDAEFLAMQARGEFLESAQVHGNRYGTSKKVILDALAAGEDLILEIDWQGAEQVRRLYPGAVGIFILPPSIEELERRLRARAQDSDAVIRQRLENAREELAHRDEFKYVIINKDFEAAHRQLAEVIQQERADPHGTHHR
jgi:guanylate kinase